jgi:hypothetical protein
MHKSATKCNETIGKWCKNKHRALKIMDTLETYQTQISSLQKWFQNFGSNFFDQSERTKLKIQWEMHL